MVRKQNEQTFGKKICVRSKLMIMNELINDRIHNKKNSSHNLFEFDSFEMFNLFIRRIDLHKLMRAMI